MKILLIILLFLTACITPVKKEPIKDKPDFETCKEKVIYTCLMIENFTDEEILENLKCLETLDK